MVGFGAVKALTTSIAFLNVVIQIQCVDDPVIESVADPVMQGVDDPDKSTTSIVASRANMSRSQWTRWPRDRALLNLLCALGDAGVTDKGSMVVDKCTDISVPPDYRVQVCGQWQCSDQPIDHCFFTDTSTIDTVNSMGAVNMDINTPVANRLPPLVSWWAQSSVSRDRSTFGWLRRSKRCSPTTSAWPPCSTRYKIHNQCILKDDAEDRPPDRLRRCFFKAVDHKRSPDVPINAKVSKGPPVCQLCQPFLQCDGHQGQSLDRTWRLLGDALVTALVGKPDKSDAFSVGIGQRVSECGVGGDDLASGSDTGAPTSVSGKNTGGDDSQRSFIRSVLDRTAFRASFDYASAKSGARLMTYAGSVRRASAILTGDRSTYMITECDSRVWFVVSFFEDLFLEHIGLESFEFFSSRFRHLQILGSSKYPTNEWRLLGEIETSPTAQHEIFDIGSRCRLQTDQCWVRFVKVRALSHHKLEDGPFCTLTSFQAFGLTQMTFIEEQSTSSAMHRHIERTVAQALSIPKDTLLPTSDAHSHEELTSTDSSESESVEPSTSLSQAPKPPSQLPSSSSPSAQHEPPESSTSSLSVPLEHSDPQTVTTNSDLQGEDIAMSTLQLKSGVSLSEVYAALDHVGVVLDPTLRGALASVLRADAPESRVAASNAGTAAKGPPRLVQMYSDLRTTQNMQSELKASVRLLLGLLVHERTLTDQWMRSTLATTVQHEEIPVVAGSIAEWLEHHWYVYVILVLLGLWWKLTSTSESDQVRRERLVSDISEALDGDVPHSVDVPPEIRQVEPSYVDIPPNTKLADEHAPAAKTVSGASGQRLARELTRRKKFRGGRRQPRVVQRTTPLDDLFRVDE